MSKQGSETKKPARVTKGYVPHEAHCVRSLAFFIRQQVRVIRNMKHARGQTLENIHETFPDVDQVWLHRIAYYKVWPLLEFETGIVTIMCDLYTVSAEELLMLAGQFGFRMSLQDQVYIRKYEPEFKVEVEQKDGGAE